MTTPRTPRHRPSFLCDADDLAPNRRDRSSEDVTRTLDERVTDRFTRRRMPGRETAIFLVALLILSALAMGAAWKRSTLTGPPAPMFTPVRPAPSLTPPATPAHTKE